MAFSVQSAKSQLLGQVFTCTFSRPLNLATSSISATTSTLNVIYAVGLTPVTGSATNPQGAKLVQHDFQGPETLTIVRQDGSSTGNTPAPTSTQSGNATVGTPVVPESPNPVVTSSPSPSNNNNNSEQQSADELLARVFLYQKLVKAHGKSRMNNGKKKEWSIDPLPL